MSDADIGEVDIQENFDVLIDASKVGWDLEADELLLTTLTALQEKFLDRLNNVRMSVDSLSDDVQTGTASFQNAINNFIQLSQNQFVENRCAIEDDEDGASSDGSEGSPKDSGDKTPELDPDERTKLMYSDAVETCVRTLEERTIPLFDSDEEEEDEEDNEKEEEVNVKSHYRRRVQLAMIGTHDFLNDPHCGLKGVDGEEFMQSSEDSSDSEAEPISMMSASRNPPQAVTNVVPMHTTPSTAPVNGGVTTVSSAAPKVIDPIARARVTALYQKYNSTKMQEVDKLLVRYAGKEDALIGALVKKYGPEPGNEEAVKKLNPAFKKKGFGDDDSDDDLAKPKPPTGTNMKMKMSLAQVSDSDSDAPPKKAKIQSSPKKAKTESPKKAKTESPKKATGESPRKNLARKIFSEDSDDEGPPKPALAKGPKKAVSKKAVSSSGSDSDGGPPKPALAKGPKKAVGKGLSRNLEESDSDDTMPASAAKKKVMPPRPKPKAKGKSEGNTMFDSDSN